jgi:hypothetical protein
VNPVPRGFFSSTKFTLERIAPATAYCGITLPEQHRWRRADLRQTWQSRVTCTYTPYMGPRFDARFTEDQAFTLRQVQLRILEQMDEEEGVPAAGSR